jgi:hypothetical protein
LGPSVPSSNEAPPQDAPSPPTVKPRHK